MTSSAELTLTRSLALALGLAVALPAPATGQLLRGDATPSIDLLRPPVLVLADHTAPGGPLLVFSLSASPLIAYDFATLPASIRWYEERFPDGPDKSVRTARTVSAIATAGPILAGVALVYTHAGAAEPTLHQAGFILFSTGLVLGPSAGHFYAYRYGRGLHSAALRAALIAIGTLTWVLLSGPSN